MTKFNWNRVRFENLSARYGSENIKTGHQTDPQPISHSYHNESKPSLRTAQSTSRSAPPNKTPGSSRYTSPADDIIEITCPSGTTDGRIRLPKKVFDSNGVCYVNGRKFISKKKDQYRSTKFQPSELGAEMGDTIVLIRENRNRWTAKVIASSNRKLQPPPIARRPLKQAKLSPVTIAHANVRSPFSDIALRDWLFAESGSIFDDVATVGSGPFDEDEFDDFLRRIDVNPVAFCVDTEILVVGRTGWTKVDLERLVDLRSGEVLRIYSQEMYLAYCLTGRDPLDEPDVARRFGEGHPALDFLSTIGFKWASTIAAEGDGSFDEDLPTVGMLKHHGYSVGAAGRDKRERHRILHRVFNSDLPIVESAAYTGKWGRRGTADRLEKIVNSLSSFCRNEKRKKSPSWIAIEDWEDDLLFLKKNYYKGRFSFQWPSTSSG